MKIFTCTTVKDFQTEILRNTNKQFCYLLILIDFNICCVDIIKNQIEQKT